MVNKFSIFDRAEQGEAHPVLRAHSWLYAQGPLLRVHGEPYGMCMQGKSSAAVTISSMIKTNKKSQWLKQLLLQYL